MCIRNREEDRMLGRIQAARRTDKPAETFDVSWREDVRYGVRLPSEEHTSSEQASSQNAPQSPPQPRAKNPVQSNDKPPPWMKSGRQRKKWLERKAQRDAQAAAEERCQADIDAILWRRYGLTG